MAGFSSLDNLITNVSSSGKFWRADWNKNANNWNKVGEGQFGTSLQGMTFGAQVEAWW